MNGNNDNPYDRMRDRWNGSPLIAVLVGFGFVWVTYMSFVQDNWFMGILLGGGTIYCFGRAYRLLKNRKS